MLINTCEPTSITILFCSMYICTLFSYGCIVINICESISVIVPFYSMTCFVMALVWLTFLCDFTSVMIPLWSIHTWELSYGTILFHVHMTLIPLVMSFSLKHVWSVSAIVSINMCFASAYGLSWINVHILLLIWSQLYQCACFCLCYGISLTNMHDLLLLWCQLEQHILAYVMVLAWSLHLFLAM